MLQRGRRSLWPIVGCTIGYVLCILFSVTLIYNVGAIDTHFWLSRALTIFGAWIPANLDPFANTLFTHQASGFTELMGMFVLAFVLYGYGALLVYRYTKFGPDKRIHWLIWSAVIISGCIYLFTPGILTSDVYSYTSYGRLLAVHAANPYFAPPSAFPLDPVYQFVYWKNTISIYGPVWMGVCAFLSSVCGTSQMRIVLVYRLFALAAHLVNVFLVAKTLRAMGRSHRTVTVGMLLYALNPLVLEESSLGAHNDVFMVTFLLLGLFLSGRAEQHYSLLRPRGYLPPLGALTLATLVKFSAAPVIIIFLLALGILALRSAQHTHGRLEWRFACKHVLIGGSFSLLLGLVCYAPFWFGHNLSSIITSFTTLPSALDSFNSILSTFAYLKYTHSLSSIFFFLLNRKMWNVLTALAVVVPIVAGGLLLWKAPTTRSIALVSLASLSAFLIVTPWFFSWYLTWVVALAVVCLPVIGDRFGRALVAFALSFSATSLFTYYSTVVGWLQLNHENPPYAGWAIWQCLAAMGIPVLVFCLFMRFVPAYYRRRSSVRE
ncbi:MAG TPA: hypothetical protein VL461_07245 [Dictyobacter sp.]|nr:hypothetical protein [Dictyobacter sp.]